MSTRNMGGRGILNIQTFNKALLAKWWWKIYTGHQGCWSKIIHLNYLIRGPRNQWGMVPQNKSFFWAGITLIIPSFKICTSKSVRNGATTLFWYHNCLEGRAPKDLWPKLFNDYIVPWVTIRQFKQDISSHGQSFKLPPQLISFPFCSQF